MSSSQGGSLVSRQVLPGYTLRPGYTAGYIPDRRDQGRVPHEVLMTQAMTSKTSGRQAGASLLSVLVSSLVQRGKAQAWSTEASGKGCHFSATRPRPAEWQDGGHRGAQDDVIASAFGSRSPTLVRITCARCSPSKWSLLAPFPLNIWEEDQGL